MAGSKSPGALRRETEVDGERDIKKENLQVSRRLYYHPHSDQTEYQGFLTKGKLEALARDLTAKAPALQLSLIMMMDRKTRKGVLLRK